MSAYYNEFDPNAALWLRELIKRGLIADGEVDTRSIEDVTPDDLRPFTQCHFFAGIGGWSVALRLAGWGDELPVWTGSCPCQPFSSAGKGGGFSDERHLWPAFHHLIGQCRPAVVFGEQVASKDGLAWLDLVRADLEGSRYAVGAADLCAAGIGAPHIRQRLYWVADADARGQGMVGVGGSGVDCGGSRDAWIGSWRGGSDGRLADAESLRQQGQPIRATAGLSSSGIAKGSEFGGLANSDGGSGWGNTGRLHAPEAETRGVRCADGSEPAGAVCPVGLADAVHSGRAERGTSTGLGSTAGGGSTVGPIPYHQHWRAADWLGCRDGKWRPVEPGTFPLAHGLPARVGRLRGYGNAIVPQVAATFVEAYLDTTLA